MPEHIDSLGQEELEPRHTDNSPREGESVIEMSPQEVADFLEELEAEE